MQMLVNSIQHFVKYLIARHEFNPKIKRIFASAAFK